MPPTFRDFLDKLRLTADILDVVGRHVELKKAGSRWKGLCPFHNEKTPSFVVSPDRQSFYCFGCHEHGDAIGFIAKIENLDWREAAIQLGKQYGLEPPARSSGADDEKQRKFFEELLAVNALAQEFFANTLKSPAGSTARKYLAEREINDETIARFGIGLSPAAWDHFMHFGRQKNFSEEIMLAAGLLIRNEDKNRTYDRFRNRIMFPICDSVGRPIAFGGRVFGPAAEDDGAKYINSPETPLYKKGHNLYAYHLAREPIHQRKTAIILEGYTDVIALHRHGFTHSAASLGTALTPEQARLLRRLCREVVFLYDDDDAGQTAMLRGTEILLAQEFTVRCVGLKAGEDPDSFLRQSGPDAFADRVKAARPFFDHFLNLGMTRFDKATVMGRTAITEMLGPLIKAVTNVIEADEYVQRLGESLSLSPDVVRAHLRIGPGRQSRPKATKPFSPGEESHSEEGEPSPVEKAFLRILIDRPELAGSIQRFNLAWIEHAAIRRLLERMLSQSTSTASGWQGIVDEASEEEKKLLRALALSEEDVVNPEIMLQQVCRRLEIRNRQKQANALRKSLGGQNLASIDEMNEQLREIQEHNQNRLKASEEIRKLNDDSSVSPLE